MCNVFATIRVCLLYDADFYVITRNKLNLIYLICSNVVYDCWFTVDTLNQQIINN